MRYIYIPEYFKNLLERSSFSFSKAMHTYAKKYIETDYYDDFVKLIDKNALAARFREDDIVSYSYIKVNGAQMKLKIIKINKTAEEHNETVWIFSGDTEEI